ncbi:hypothetical protein E4T50_13926 [Aureobasidium sp. EXF-12298]|nr:hypothetical protein E4T50_13926 [Aureobasidium sp. EXF-12298]
MLTRTFAAALSRAIDLRMVAPSLDLVHSLGTQSGLDEVSYSDSANKGRQTGILALFLCDIVGEDLRGVVVRLEKVSKIAIDPGVEWKQTIVAMCVGYVDEEGTKCWHLVVAS